MPIDIDSFRFVKLKDGNAYTVSEVVSVSGGGTTNIHVKNPSGSDTDLFVATVTVNGDGAFIARLHDDFSSAPSGGTSTEIQNLLMDTEKDSTDNGVAEVAQDVSFTSSSEHAVGVGGGGQGSSSVGMSVEHVTSIMEPDREIVLEVENTTTAEQNYSLTIAWAQTPKGGNP